ncbi:fibronectin type III domain-containing protein [Spirilliplanes yamanashiensis]|nr:fibronectin type III domain-containing protein [Spirilliplanes yamanashiensis]MDP9819207.1 hypothetical protein [Spirilliplanes yamanashiensis]
MSRRLLPCLLLAASLALVAPPASAAADPGRRAPAAPGTPTATNGFSSITLTWSQPAAGRRPHHFRVYEGDTVVARNTTTHVTVTGLGFGTTHTYRVAAVAHDGTESALSAPVTRHVWVSGMQPQCQPGPGPLTVADVGPTAFSLSWPAGETPRHVRVTVAGRQLDTAESSLRVGGLTPGTAYTATIRPLDCPGPPWPGTLHVTTPAGPGDAPAAPAGLAVTGSTDTGVDLAWTPPAGGAARYAVWSGTRLVTTTSRPSVRLTGLWRDTVRTVAVSALSGSGAESAATPPVEARTQRCAPATPAPVDVAATAVTASSVSLTWTSVVEASTFVVTDGDRQLATVAGPSAHLSGLPPATRHRLRVVTRPAGCPDSAPSRTARVRTAAGPADRPAAPADLRPVGGWPAEQGIVAVQWTAPPGDVAAYRIYEGATLVATTTATAWTGQFPPATTHLLSVVAVDAAGSESAPSNAVQVTASFFAPPAPPPGGPGGPPPPPPGV